MWKVSVTLVGFLSHHPGEVRVGWFCGWEKWGVEDPMSWSEIEREGSTTKRCPRDVEGIIPPRERDKKGYKDEKCGESNRCIVFQVGKKGRSYQVRSTRGVHDVFGYKSANKNKDKYKQMKEEQARLNSANRIPKQRQITWFCTGERKERSIT